MRRSLRCRLLCRLLLSAILGAGFAVVTGVAPVGGLGAPGGGRAMAAGGGVGIPAPAAPAHAGSSEPAVQEIAGMVNLHHLDSLVGEVRLPNGQMLPYWSVYAEPDRPGDRTGPYHFVEAASEGISCVDDVARAAVAYLAHYRVFGDQHSLDMARKAFQFIEYQRTPDGLFYNFILSSGAQNQLGGTSEQGLNWWSARALWALSEGYAVFRELDPAYARHLENLMQPAIEALRNYVAPGSTHGYGTYKTLHGEKVPAWLISDGSDASSVVLMALTTYYQAGPRAVAPEVLREIAIALGDGIAVYQRGTPDEPPFLAHLPWGQSLYYWHAWGSAQVGALAQAGKVFGRPDWIMSAQKEAVSFYSHMLASIGIWADQGPVPLTYVQLAYGTEVVTNGLLRLSAATGNPVFSELAGISGAWLFGNNVAQFPMYDPQTGRGWDGIDPPGGAKGLGVSFNAGAESTIESLYTLINLAQDPVAARYLGLRPYRNYAYQVVEAESYEKADAGRPRKVWAQWAGDAEPSGQFYVTSRPGEAYTLRFWIGTEDDYLVYAYYQRQGGPAGSVGMTFRLDEGSPLAVDVSGSPDGPYWLGQKLTSHPVHLKRGYHTIQVETTGSARFATAALDALVLQPVIEWRHMVGVNQGTPAEGLSPQSQTGAIATATGPGGSSAGVQSRSESLASGPRNVVLFRSFESSDSERTFPLDVRKSVDGKHITLRIRAYDGAGHMALEKTLSVSNENGLESVSVPIPVKGFGFTLVSWD